MSDSSCDLISSPISSLILAFLEEVVELGRVASSQKPLFMGPGFSDCAGNSTWGAPNFEEEPN